MPRARPPRVVSTGGGGGAGKAEFSPLTVDIHSLAGLTTLLGDVATGHHLTSVELVGAETIKGERVKVYDVKLSEVLVSSFENDPSSNRVETSLSFNYNKISLTDQPTTHGILGTPQTFAFDLSENKIAAAVSSRAHCADDLEDDRKHIHLTYEGREAPPTRTRSACLFARGCRAAAC